MTDNIRPAVYGAEYEAIIANKAKEPFDDLVTVVGKVLWVWWCFNNMMYTCKKRSGDILAVTSTGAYGFSMASGYNKNLRPAVVFVRDGEAKIVVKDKVLKNF